MTVILGFQSLVSGTRPLASGSFGSLGSLCLAPLAVVRFGRYDGFGQIPEFSSPFSQGTTTNNQEAVTMAWLDEFC